MMSNAEFEAFVKRELGDIAVMDDGRYISPKIQKYWLTWCAATERAARIAESDEFYGSVVPVAIAVAIRGEPKPTPLTPEQEAVAKRAWAMAHEIMWEGTNLRIEDVERATLREKPDLSTDVLRENGDLSTEALIEAADKHADSYEGGGSIPVRDVRAAITNAFYAGAGWFWKGQK